MEQIFFYFFIFLVGGMFWHVFKPLPKNIDYESEQYNVSEQDIEFLYDLTVGDKIDQRIFKEIFVLIDKAEKYILIDMFLFNSFNLEKNKIHEKLHDKISEKLLQKKRDFPKIKIDIITDSINTVYGGVKNEEFNKFKKNGINIITTDLKKIRDSNPVYSIIWRCLFQWLGNSSRPGLFPHPFSTEGQKVSLRTYLFLLNFKANHRKVVVADCEGEMVSIITSANFHNASSAHSNIAIKIKGDFWQEIYISEKAVAKFSGGNMLKQQYQIITKKKKKKNDKLKLSLVLLTEQKIRQGLTKTIESTRKGDTIQIGVFYLSSRRIIKDLIKASKRGVIIKIILDPNKDAFGYNKNGIPNRQVANELIKRANKKIKVRWYNTTGEQFHSKFLLVNKKNGKAICVLGSANFTRRNLENYNLETDVMIFGESKMQYFRKMNEYFDTIWQNKNGRKYTLEYRMYQDKSMFKKMVYRMQEFTGISGF
jgi:phosphatidylserine/phosphatidylglycerophosphate/cardiolipin synthase-like enzyme